MDQVAPQFRAIAARRQAIAQETAKLRIQLDALELESSELEVAARVLQRLGLLADESGPELPLPSISLENEAKLTVPDMIKAVISGFTDVGLPGATNQQVLNEMTRRWGISDANIVRPTLWRMVKYKRLVREGDIYSLPAASTKAEKVEPRPVSTRPRLFEVGDAAASNTALRVVPSH